MVYEIIFTNQQLEEITQNYEAKVKENLRSKIKSKNKEIVRKNSKESVKQRFHRGISTDDFDILEMRFSANSKSFRAILFLFNEVESIPLYAVIPKNSSGQSNFIEDIKENSGEILDSFNI